MRPILFRIPLDGSLDLGPLGQVPVFGLGLLFGVWLAVGLFFWFRRRRSGGEPLAVGDFVTYGVIGAAIVLAPTIGARFNPHPSIPLFGYGLMMCLGFVSATVLAAQRATRAGFPPEKIWDLTFLFLLSGVGGARLFYLIQHGDRVYARCETAGDYLKATINLPDGGLVLYGGLIAGVVVYAWFCRTRKIDAWKLGDLIVPSIFLGIACGRVGCFLYGCCFGDRCDLPWAVEFPGPRWDNDFEGSVPFKSQMQRGFLPDDATVSLPLHPTQLYSVIDGVLLCLLTLAYYPVRARDGSVVTLALLTYPVTRFFIERLRGDELGQFGTSLTIAQWISLVMLAGGIGLAIWRPPVLKSLPIPPATGGASTKVSTG
jgi:phosphatidylglycerol:prolipoprotein diacylglycerol transferase